MKHLRLRPDTLGRSGLALTGGALLAAAFPKLGVAGFAWVAPGIILASAMGVEGGRAFRLGYLAGLTHYLITLYWLLNIPVIKLAPISAWLGLSAFLSLYPGLWAWLSWRCYPRRLEEGGGSKAEILERFLEAPWGQRMLWALSTAAFWVAWEMTQARFLSGFPWNFLGASQYRMLPMIQLASVTGVYGISFLAVWFSVSGVCASVMVLRRADQSRRWLGELILPLLAGVATVGWGGREVMHSSTPAGAPTLKIALVQPSIPQQWIWSAAENARRFEKVLELSEGALAEHPDLLVWPEAATPGYVRWETNVYQPITNLVQRHHTWLILGADDLTPRHKSWGPSEYDAFNSAFLVNPRGEFEASYRKRRLVIFGEYLPFHRWFPFLERWTGLGSFTPGDTPVPFLLPDKHAKTSVLICFEDVFPHLTRAYVQDDTDFLLNLTNNGWFGESAAQWQHAANAVLRAVENRVPLVRCANNGLTCWVDAQGRMAEVEFPGTTDIYGVGVKTVDVPLLNGKTRAGPFYRRYGDVFGWTCSAWTALAAGAAWFTGRIRKRRS